jgi:colanic acid/amylovoran biosynthesis glycosyltransferase
VRPTVAHVAFAFVPVSEAWMYDVITAPVSYEAHVLTPSRENAVDFPFERITLFSPDAAPRGSRAWLHRQLYSRLGWPPTPPNTWSRPLRRVASEPALFHAHYGLVGWRVVDAGLSPAVTSFYGFDASEASVLADWRAAYRRLFRRGAAFVAEGPAMRERLLQLGAPPERTHVVPLIARLGEEWEPASVGNGGPARILMAGRLVEKKGFSDGVAAFAEARRRGIEAHLQIVGTGPEEERLRLAVSSHGVTDDVEFLAAQPRGRFRELLRASHVILQPSRTASDGDVEGGAPTTLLEAQALGRVVVATDHADIPNVVEPDAAYLSPEGDAEGLATNLIRALEATAEWPARGAAGRRFVEQNHSSERVAGLLDRLYDGVTDA